MIEVELKVVSGHKDGLLMALGEVLLANQFTLLRHRRANTADGVVMTLVVKGPEANLLRLEEQLGTHYMVSSFEAGIYDPNAPVAPLPPSAVAVAAPAAPAPATQAAPAKPASNGAADQKRIEQLLPQIAREYPQIFGPLVSLEHGLEPAQREATMRYIGTRVGAWVYKRDFSLGARQPLAGSITHIALPALKQLLPVRGDGDALATSGSPFASPDRKVTAPQCHFLRGFLEGVLNEPGHLGVVRVSETGCRSCGDEECRFVFHV